MNDRVLIPFGNHLLALSRDAFETALRDGTAIVCEGRGAGSISSEDTASEAPRQSLLTPADAAQLLAVDATWLLRQAREGRIPHIRLGKYVRFNANAIVAQCTKAPEAAP